MIYVKITRSKPNYLFVVEKRKRYYVIVMYKIEIGINETLIPTQLRKLIN